ncbi:hypothetical protein [Rhodobacter sp. TJ_12]|uniref:hypothetical protein n=1 Tax=Rhodobacter sp. TJ_12 TaxID=2029399 RepID=UPI001CBF34DC|nr:hypothetical protein [Rhodobacter sp. TJ_12]
MTNTNLQKSELVISKILECLLDRGLQHGTRLCFTDLDLPSDHLPIYNGCCTWLIEEGIIRCEGKAQPIVGPCVLQNPMITSKGFSILDQTFIAQEGKVRVGHAVKEVASGSINYAGIGDFFGGLLGGFTKSIGS